MKLLLELRPALEGHAGIPQETRLLFRGLGQLPGLKVDGLLQAGGQRLARGLPADGSASGWAPDRRIDRLSRVVISLQPHDDSTGRLRHALRALQLGVATAGSVLTSLLGRVQPLTQFEPAGFEDFIWRALFAKSLPAADLPRVTAAGFRVARLPWSAAHAAARFTARLGRAIYPRLDTRAYDLLIAETPYPGRVCGRTRLVVRYHDAIPMLMPHTIVNRAYHQAAHFQALRRNVLDGAWFACVSDASRRDLISVFPQAEARAVTIHNMVSHNYFLDDRPDNAIADILRTRANRGLGARRGADPADRLAPALLQDEAASPDYLLSVSTLEPRKNHLGLLSAWETLRACGHPDLKLVLVGMLGWNNQLIVQKLIPWVAQGHVHILDDVPASDLRLLYRHARATVCPSFGEGFGFPGVEAMASGGVVAASDLPVHREVYGEAAAYFNPYAPDHMAQVIDRLIAGDTPAQRQAREARGLSMAAHYRPERILPLWQTFLEQLSPPA